MSANKQDLDAAQEATAVVLASIEASLLPPPFPVDVDLTAEVAKENALTEKARSILLKLQSQTVPAAPPPAA